jgi:hypothetical protein
VPLQTVSVDDRKHAVLLPGRQCCQPVGQGRADAPASELPVDRCAQVPANRHASRYPERLAPKQGPHSPLAHSLVVDQRANNPRLVRSCQCPQRRVGLEQQPFELRSRAGSLEHDRHQLVPLFEPTREPLETVDDLPATIMAWGHPDGPGRGPCWSRPHIAGPQALVRRLQLLDRNKADAEPAGDRRRQRLGDHG